MKTTIEIPDELLRQAESRAASDGIRLKDLVEHGLRLAIEEPELCQSEVADDFLANAPIVRRLSGSLSADLSLQDYREHLVRKHGA